MKAKSDRYADAGVNIDLAGQLLGEVKDKIKGASRAEVLAPIGGFGGLFQLDLNKYQQPVIVASVDGVGTKLLIAEMMDKHDTVGHDIVNHCVNDIIVQGAEPLYFMDYLGIGKLRSPLYEDVLSGLTAACKAQNVALLGGETAEMPGMYGEHYDLVGSITGIVDKQRIITGDKIKPGDTIVGMASNGLHTNGYSLARKVIFEEAGLKVDDKLPELDGKSVGEALLLPHVCYWPVVSQLLGDDVDLHGMAHITGGGFYDNVPRVLPEGVGAKFKRNVMSIPPIFKLIQEKGEIGEQEMYRVFNMGVGMMLIVPPSEAEKCMSKAYSCGIPADIIGEITDGDRAVKIEGIDI